MLHAGHLHLNSWSVRLRELEEGRTQSSWVPPDCVPKITGCRQWCLDACLKFGTALLGAMMRCWSIFALVLSPSSLKSLKIVRTTFCSHTTCMMWMEIPHHNFGISKWWLERWQHKKSKVHVEVVWNKLLVEFQWNSDLKWLWWTYFCLNKTNTHRNIIFYTISHNSSYKNI